MFQSTQVIHVKRKRDDAPVDSLYLESNSKRARPNLAPQFYFKRLKSPRPVSVTATSTTTSLASLGLADEPPPAPPSILRRDTSQYEDQRPLILGPDGCPAILSAPEGEELRDPYALHQHERLAREAERRRVVVQLPGGSTPSFSISRDIADAHGEKMDVDGDSGDGGGGGDFVYDVFVAAAVSTAKGNDVIKWATSQPDGLAGTVLVGEEDTEWIGDYFYEGAGDEADDDRVYSDDEDSNAEDYYGADYPEDEDEDINNDGYGDDGYD